MAEQQDTPAGDYQTVRQLLWRHGKEYAQLPNGPGFFSGLPVAFQAVINTWSGSHKSHYATEFVNQAWDKAGQKGLYLMLSHDAIEERLRQLSKDGKAEAWSHWRRHDDNCEQRQFNDAGYSRLGKCKCDRGERTAEGPTLAPLEYAFPRLPGEYGPLIPLVNEFNFWVIDEVDFRRFLGLVNASGEDVAVVAESHPDQAVRALCQAFGQLMGQVGGKRLNGRGLYDALDGCLKATGSGLASLVAGLGEADLTRQAWLDPKVAPLPKNFPPTLVPVLLDEAADWSEGIVFNPRIHLVKAAGKGELRVWWRKELRDGPVEGDPDLPDSQPEWIVPPFFILDATASKRLLGKVCDFAYFEHINPPPWPDNVHVHQWVDDVVSRQTLGIPFGGDAFSHKSKQARHRWYERIANVLRDFPRDWPVGIITHKVIEGEAKEAIREGDFTHVCSLHYGAERGSNTLEDVRVLVLLGLPIPNPNEFEEEAQAFLYDERLLDFTWEQKTLSLDMRGGPKVPVTVGGYWKEPVASYYRQKCQASLYQAMHRIRPDTPREYERHIYIFTNMPIPGVKVDYALRSEVRQEVAERDAKVVSEIDKLLAQQGQCTISEVAAALEPEEKDARRWLQRNAQRLAQATGSTFEPGRGGRPGKFMRQAQ